MQARPSLAPWRRSVLTCGRVLHRLPTPLFEQRLQLSLDPWFSHVRSGLSVTHTCIPACCTAPLCGCCLKGWCNHSTSLLASASALMIADNGEGHVSQLADARVLTIQASTSTYHYVHCRPAWAVHILS